MFSRVRVLSILILSFIVLIPAGRASHAVGMELFYDYAGNNKYEITVIFYRDCAGVPGPTGPINLSVFSQNCSINTQVPLYLQLPVIEVSQLCPLSINQSACMGGTLPGLEKFEYKGIYDAGLNYCNDWRFQYSVCCRNAAVTNLSNLGTAAAVAWMDNTVHGADTIRNRSVRFSSFPNPEVCVNQLFYYNPGAVDPDRDSLVVYLTNPRTGPNPGDTISFNPGFSVTHPVFSNPQMTIDSSSGQMLMTPAVLQMSVVAICVEEWRKVNGTPALISRTFREQIIYANNCTNLQPLPDPAGIFDVTGGTKTGPFELRACSGDTITLKLAAYDPNGDPVLVNTLNTDGSCYNSCLCSMDTIDFTWVPEPWDVGLNLPVFVIQDANCPIQGTQWVAVKISIIPASFNITSVSAVPSPVCGGDSVQLDVTLDSMLSYTYHWSPGNVLNDSTIRNPVAAPSSTTTFSVIVSNPGGCSNGAKIKVNTLPFVTATSNSPRCAGENLLLSASGGVNYTWTGPSGFTSSFQNPVILNVDTSHSGNYIVTITDSGGCVSSAVTMVVVNPLPVPQAASNSPVCAGDTIRLSATGGAAYLWTNTSGFYSSWQKPIISNCRFSDSGVYYVTVANAALCTAKDSTRVVILPSPVVNATSNSPVCEGDSLLLFGSPGLSHQWWGPLGFSSVVKDPVIPNATIFNSGVYTLMVTGSNGCSFSDYTAATVTPCPGIIALEQVPGLRVYPNPSDGELIMITESISHGEMQLEIMDMLGRVRESYSGKDFKGNQLKADLSEYPPGVYCITLTVGSVHTLRTVILH